MVLLTMVARASDGLPLATSIEGDDQHEQNMVKYTNQAKLLFRKLNASSPQQCSLESGQYMFHYTIMSGVCFLCVCASQFPAKVAFKYLEDIGNEFISQNGSRIASVNRPYHFIEFDSYIQTARRRYADTRARYQLGAVGQELQDVQRVMVQNIEDVIHRGEALNILDDKAASLSVMSKKYRSDARYLNLRSTYTKIAIVLVIVVALLLFVRFKWL